MDFSKNVPKFFEGVMWGFFVGIGLGLGVAWALYIMINT